MLVSIGLARDADLGWSVPGSARALVASRRRATSTAAGLETGRGGMSKGGASAWVFLGPHL